MESIIIAIIGGLCTLLAAFVGPLLSRRSRRRKNLLLGKEELAKLADSPEVLVLTQTLETTEEDEIEALWIEFLADTSEDNLELYLHKIDSLVEKRPDEISLYTLKESVQTAIRIRNQKRSENTRFTKLLASITFQTRKLLASLMKVGLEYLKPSFCQQPGSFRLQHG